jgi:inosine-uridine nucleoside N-ribohydrolase
MPPNVRRPSKILIDCDPGHDDAVAILYAASHLDLVGVTTTHGNNTLENVTANALAVLALGGIDVPLAMGCATPLAGPANAVAAAHGSTGLDGTRLPAPAARPIDVHAVDFIIDTAHRLKGELVLAAIGPATNVAMALKREPRLASWLREITVMGGSAGMGNITPAAEFNTWCDPEAASVLFSSGARIRMVGYDVTARTGADAADIARLRTGGLVAGHVADLLAFYLGRQRALYGMDLAPLHDVCAITPYVDDTLLHVRDCHVAVELHGWLTRGMTVCDLRAMPAALRAERGLPAANVTLALASDARRLVDDVIDTLIRYPEATR